MPQVAEESGQVHQEGEKGGYVKLEASKVSRSLFLPSIREMGREKGGDTESHAYSAHKIISNRFIAQFSSTTYSSTYWLS